MKQYKSSSENETIVLDYSLLENSYYFDSCDLIIKSTFPVCIKLRILYAPSHIFSTTSAFTPFSSKNLAVPLVAKIL